MPMAIHELEKAHKSIGSRSPRRCPAFDQGYPCKSGSVVVTGLSGSGDDWNEMGGIREAALFSASPVGGGSGWDGDENWNLDQTGLVIVDGSVLGRSSAINQAYVGNYDLWTPNYGGATVTWGRLEEPGRQELRSAHRYAAELQRADRRLVR